MRSERPLRIGVVSLGCAKNLVDTEALLGYAVQAGVHITTDPESADVLVINTCGFIADARDESYETIQEMLKFKKRDPHKKIVVAGCLVQRSASKILDMFPEIDYIMSLDEIPDFPHILEKLSRAQSLKPKYTKTHPATWMYDGQVQRILATPGYYAYLKIAEGCNHTCAFCTIPSIRGEFRSRSPENIFKEAQELVRAGVRELVLIAQDTLFYGNDIGLKHGLFSLFERLHELSQLKWIRLLYLYPEGPIHRIVEMYQTFPKLVPYLDIPFQHSHPDILKAMRRPGTGDGYKRFIEHVREKIPEISVRTSVIVGFPGETHKHFEHLVEFIRSVQFDHLGIFTYSDEAGTIAHTYCGKVAPDVMMKRRAELESVQFELIQTIQEKHVGKVYECLVEKFLEKNGKWFYYSGRHSGQAPEIDGGVMLRSQRELQIGSFVRAKIERAYGYDLEAHVVTPPP